MTSFAFLVNPASANGSTGRAWPEIAHRAARAGVEGQSYLSGAPGELSELAARAAEAGADVVVAVGGDGTVNEVARGLLARRQAGARVPELAVIPRGTGRDFVRTFRIPGNLEQALAIVRAGECRAIDAGAVRYRSWDGSEGTSFFVNVASAGMSGAIAKRANETSKALGGKVSFLVATLAVFPRWAPDEMTVEVDGSVRTERMRDVIVANCRFLGGGMKMCPQALPDDGLFDVLTLGEITNSDLVRNLPKIYRGTHLPHPRATLSRGARVTVESEAAVPIELDGEQPGTTPVVFEVLPRALTLRVAAGAGLA